MSIIGGKGNEKESIGFTCWTTRSISGICWMWSKPNYSNCNKWNRNNTDRTKRKKEDLEVLEHSVVQDGYLSYVVGKIKNNTNRTYSYVQVSINLYKGKSQAGSTLANVNNLEPGGTWEFKAMVTNTDATSYKIVDVTGF